MPLHPCSPPRVNHWPDARCAKSFWGQHDLPPYRRLLADTVDRAAPAAGERWLDLGCGGGAVTRELWGEVRGSGGGGGQPGLCSQKRRGVRGAACGRTNAATRRPGADYVHDFSDGLGLFADGRFEGVVSGLSISYATSSDPETGEWTTAAYDRLLAEAWARPRPRRGWSFR